MFAKPQHLRALDQANAVRVEGANFKRKVFAHGYREGCELLAETLLDADRPEGVSKMPVHRFLKAARFINSSRAHVILDEADIYRRSANHRHSSGPLQVGDLTKLERDRLVRVLRSRSE